MSAPKPILSDAFWRPLVDAGVIPEDPGKVRRVVIDIQAQEPVIVYVEQYGDARLLQVAQTLQGVEIRGVPA